VATLVYVLCAVTSLACAVLLLRSYRQQRLKLLLWSGLCFAGFAFGNAALILDQVVLPGSDLWMLRSFPVLAGLGILVYGMIWEA
jgi:hypothetical protein